MTYILVFFFFNLNIFIGGKDRGFVGIGALFRSGLSNKDRKKETRFFFFSSMAEMLYGFSLEVGALDRMKKKGGEKIEEQGKNERMEDVKTDAMAT